MDEIATPMWTGDAKTETEETVMTVMMICEGNIETEGIDEIATILTDETGIAILMGTDDEKIETGETVTIVMMTSEENSETEEIETEMMIEGETEMMTEDETEILMLIDDVKTETGGIVTIAMMNEEGRIEMSVVKTEMLIHAERGERDQQTILETTLMLDVNNALETTLK